METDLCQTTREETIVRFLPLVKQIVARLAIHCPSFLDPEDLVESGIIGLINAVDTYDPQRETAMKSYIYTKVQGAIYDELRKVSFLPRGFYHKLKKVREAFAQWQSVHGYPPALEDLADSLDSSPEELDEMLTMLRTMAVVSLDQPNGDGKETDDLIACLACPKTRLPADLVAEKELQEKLTQTIAELPEAERRVIVLYYYQELQVKEIAHLLGVSSSRISHLHSRALYRLNQKLKRMTPQRNSLLKRSN